MLLFLLFTRRLEVVSPRHHKNLEKVLLVEPLPKVHYRLADTICLNFPEILARDSMMIWYVLAPTGFACQIDVDRLSV